MPKNNNKINSINWMITKPMIYANIGYDNKRPIPIPKDLLDSKLGIRKGERVALIWDDVLPCIVTPVYGNTLRSMFKSIESGMNRILLQDERREVYVIISRFIHSKDRIRLVKKFEDNKLTPKDICGDYAFFEGNLKREKGGLWTFAIGN